VCVDIVSEDMTSAEVEIVSVKTPSAVDVDILSEYMTSAGVEIVSVETPFVLLKQLQLQLTPYPQKQCRQQQ
jgi:hypothetical protein